MSLSKINTCAGFGFISEFFVNRPLNVEPPWSVPTPKPPSLFPNIERCWLDEEINYDDPIEVYMHQQATSWTAPRQGGPTTAM